VKFLSSTYQRHACFSSLARRPSTPVLGCAVGQYVLPLHQEWAGGCTSSGTPLSGRLASLNSNSRGNSPLHGHIPLSFSKYQCAPHKFTCPEYDVKLLPQYGGQVKLLLPACVQCRSSTSVRFSQATEHSCVGGSWRLRRYVGAMYTRSAGGRGVETLPAVGC
jgi:hypothetical protein